MTSREDIRDYVISWTQRFPIDRWWRKKYNIALNSLAHRESCFIDQVIEWEEDQLFYELENTEKYVPNVGDWLKPQEVTEGNLRETINSLREEFKSMEEIDYVGD